MKGLCHDEKVSLYHAFYYVQCSERGLCLVQASRFLSPSVTIKLLSNAKYMGNICIDECEVLSASYLRETSSVGILLGDCIRLTCTYTTITPPIVSATGSHSALRIR